MAAAGEEEHARRDAEEEERSRYARKLSLLIVRCELPLARIAMEFKNPMQILDTAAGNARARTLRMRVRVCQKICDWMYATYGHPVPRRAVDL
eukprot:2176191-Karenia_brevis.AAC.1